MSRGKARSEIDDLFGDLLGDDDDLDLSKSPSPPVARKGKKVDVYDDAFYEQLAKDSGVQVRLKTGQIYVAVCCDTCRGNSTPFSIDSMLALCVFQNADDDDQPPNPQELKQTMDSINFDDLESGILLKKARKICRKFCYGK